MFRRPDSVPRSEVRDDGTVCDDAIRRRRDACAIFKLGERVEKRRETLRENRAGANDTGKADKWRLLRALTEAKAAFGLSDRSIAVLKPGELLAGEGDRRRDRGDCVSIECRAFAAQPRHGPRHDPAALGRARRRRHDPSARQRHGKRFCRRDDHGEIEAAFGFDLAPFAQAAGEIFAASENARAEAQAINRLRGEITVHRRDVVKVIEAAVNEKRAGDWASLPSDWLRVAAVFRNAPKPLLEERRGDLFACAPRSRPLISPASMNKK